MKVLFLFNIMFYDYTTVYQLTKSHYQNVTRMLFLRYDSVSR